MGGEISFIRDYNESQEKEFIYNEINSQANKDFAFLCSKVNCVCYENARLKTVRKQDNTYIGEFLVIGHDVSNKVASFPKELLDVQDANRYVAVVCYQEKEVQDVLVFKATDFQKCKGILNDDKKHNMYSVKLKNIDKLKQYSFGYVLNKI